MRRILSFAVLLAAIPALADFSDLFEEKTLRIDYYHAGDAHEEAFYLGKVIIEPRWGGSHHQLIDTLRYGQYFLEVYMEQNDSLIYSRGYCTLFGEWQTTDEAKKIKKAFQETVVMPLPREKCHIRISSRNRKGIFEEKFACSFDPADPFIIREPRNEYPAFDVQVTGDPSERVDIVILPEGYTAEDMGRFISDCRRFAEILFSFEPYSDYRELFNIRGVLAPSRDPGNDIPKDSIWARTQLGTSFYTFDSERYCMTDDHHRVRDLAAQAPYDQIYILVNSEKYGGGAIYNHYSVSVNSNLMAGKIFVHEFGHGFAGLGDEYYADETSYNDFYALDVEPWEPNLTTLVDFGRKWKHLLSPDVPVPTPPEVQYMNVTGVFEGGGYSAKGIYRPAADCLMNTFRGDRFCAVCTEAIITMIRFYTD
ncbi:MAG: peptidase M64 [Bacteroidales bacterium]|nr:peptidase M64 [Bacteroidales bacterium]